MKLTLEAIRACLDGGLPSVVATCAPDGTPNVAYASQVHYVDGEHVALSFQFFSKTRENVLAHPYAQVQVIEPASFRHFRLFGFAATEEALPAASAVRVERTVTDPVPQAIADAVSFVQEQGTARVVFAFTSSGFTAQLISNLFSPYPIIALTLNRCVMSALSLHRSVYPVLVEQPASFDEIARLVSAIGRAYAGVRPGDRVVVTGGAPFGQMKPTNFMMIVTILDERESG